MEKKLYKCLDVVSPSSGVVGSILTDNRGLCLGSEGKTTLHSGILTTIAEQAKLLEPDSDKPPVVILESDHRQFVVHRDGKTTVAIHKEIGL